MYFVVVITFSSVFNSNNGYGVETSSFECKRKWCFPSWIRYV